VLVDFRGTGASGALKCSGSGDEISKLVSGADLFLGTGEECLAAVHADVRQYTHANALADVDEIRRRLGYSRINLWGGSWGTRAALLYALTYPDAARSVVLDGAVPLDLAFPAPVARNAQRALDLLIERCEGDPRCVTAFPTPREELRAVLAGLDRPRAVSIRSSADGRAPDADIVQRCRSRARSCGALYDDRYS
jgi:pimeloyl-ACP methyl ester carboxylesterase